MTLDDAIKHCQQVANVVSDCECADEHRQLAEWLQELKEFKQKQTNEEWFCGLSTEEKAKFLFEHGVIVCNFCKGDCKEIDYKTSECKYNTSPSYSYTGIVEWLKEKHDGSV